MLIVRLRQTRKEEGRTWGEERESDFASLRTGRTLGEPAVDWREKSTGFGALTLIAPDAGEAGGGAQFKRPCTLAFRNYECLVAALLCCVIAHSYLSGDHPVSDATWPHPGAQ
jgi:hypothetical protein